MILTHWLNLFRAGLDSISFTPTAARSRAIRRLRPGYSGPELAPAFGPPLGRHHLPAMREHLRARQRRG